MLCSVIVDSMISFDASNWHTQDRSEAEYFGAV